MTRFKLQPWELTEAQIKKDVVQALRMDIRVVEVNRPNCGKISTPGRRFGIYDAFTYWLKGKKKKTTGASDIQGQLCDGRRMVFEIKTSKGVIEDDQQEYIDHAVRYGAVGGVVRRPEEALQIIREAFQ